MREDVLKGAISLSSCAFAAFSALRARSFPSLLRFPLLLPRPLRLALCAIAIATLAGCPSGGGSGGATIDALASPSGNCLTGGLVRDDPRCGPDENGVPAYRPREVEVAADGVVYLLDYDAEGETNTLYRWSMASEAHLSAVELGPGAPPKFLAYSAADDRLYLGWSNGTIRRLDGPAGASPVESSHSSLSEGLQDLVAVGGYLAALSGSGFNQRIHVFDPQGVEVSTSPRFEPNSMDFDPALGRIYGTSRGHIRYVMLDPATGAVRSEVGARTNLEQGWRAPLIVSAAGDRLVFAGSGHVLDEAFDTIETLRNVFLDGAFLDDGSLVTLRILSEPLPGTLLEHWDADYRPINAQVYRGSLIRVVRQVGKVLVVTLGDEDRPKFEIYRPGVDGDGDGIPYALDDFPLDPAASLDSDGDGAPDEWNAGQRARDSLFELVLDAFPFDSACQLVEHAFPDDPTRCDSSSAIPSYTPTGFAVDDAGIVYLLSRSLNRVFRWSSVLEEHLGSIPVGRNPYFITYSPNDDRIYIAYQNGTISYLDASGSEDPQEEFHTRLPGLVFGMQWAGDFLAISGGGLAGSWVILDSSGDVADFGGSSGGRRTAYAPDVNRLYHMPGGGTTGGGLGFTEIDPVTGEIGSVRLSDYRVGRGIDGPIHASRDGARLSVGSGAVFDGDDVSFLGRIPVTHADALWLADGSLLVIRNWAGRTRVQRWDASRRLVDVALYAGYPVGLVEIGDRILVVSLPRVSPGRIEVAFREYIPGVDGDEDGVAFAVDAFPMDLAAAIDSDADGYPDVWNAGSSESDVSPGIVLDAFPFDSACYRSDQGRSDSPDECDIEGQVPFYRPEQITADGSGIVYLLSQFNRKIYRYSLVEGRFLNPIVTETGVESIGYAAANDRLYFGYGDGRIEWVDAGDPATGASFLRTMEDDVLGLYQVGEYLVVYSGRYALTPYQSLAEDGSIVASSSGSRGSRSTEWNASTNRLYHVRDGISPDQLEWEVFDPSTGLFGARAEWPYFTEYDVATPLRVSPDGNFVALANGDVFEGDSLDYDFSLPVAYTDAIWLSGNRLVTFRDSGAGTALAEVWGADLKLQAIDEFVGEPLRVVDAGAMRGLVYMVDDRPAFSIHSPSDDSDGDGVPNELDAFPLDVAASVDGDGDGYPDLWNPGYGASDSVEGLAIDAFPDDAACQLPEHGRDIDPTICDITFGIPAYDPDDVVITDEGVVHVLSPENLRIYRWSLAEDYHLDPIVIDEETEHLAYSPDNGRLYLSYREARLTQIDPGLPTPVETAFTTLSSRALGLQALGPLILVVQFSTGVGYTTFDVGGTMLLSGGRGSLSSHFEWSAAKSTMYYSIGPYASGNLAAQTLDLATGVFSDVIRPPYIPDPDWRKPVRVSQDGAIVAMGSGRFFDGESLAPIGRLPDGFVDGVWLSDGSLLTIRDPGDGTTLVEQWGANRIFFGAWNRAGLPLRILASPTGAVLMTSLAGAPHFEAFFPLEDADGDGVANGDDAFPSDPAASLDRDGDEAPGAWNLGRDETDSTRGLSLDAFPDDPTCQDASHAYPLDPTVCDFSRSIPAYEPDDYAIDEQGTVYWLDSGAALVRRWSGPDNYHVEAIAIGAGGRRLAYSESNGRLYVGYQDGRITQIDVSDPFAGESSFATTLREVRILIAIDTLVFVTDPAHHLFSAAGGAPLRRDSRGEYSTSFDWSPATSELFLTRDSYFRRPVAALPIDTTTATFGTLRTAAESTLLYTQEPIRISEDGQTGVLGNGNRFDTSTLDPQPELPDGFIDGDWTAAGNFVSIRYSGNEMTTLEEWSSSWTLLQTRLLVGRPLRVLANSAGRVQVVVLVDGRPQVIEH